MIIDSRQFKYTIDCEDIEDFSESKDGKLQLLYYLPDPKNTESPPSKYLRKQETFDCCENQLLVKVFKCI